jgi:hypothetical protein
MAQNDSSQQTQVAPTVSSRGYYYVPYSSDGPMSKRMASYGSSISSTVVSTAMSAFIPKEATTAMKVVGGILGQLGGDQAKGFGEAFFSEVGSVFDNIDNFVQNANTAFAELNDQNSWIAPTPAD